MQGKLSVTELCEGKNVKIREFWIFIWFEARTEKRVGPICGL